MPACGGLPGLAQEHHTRAREVGWGEEGKEHVGQTGMGWGCRAEGAGSSC